MKDVSAHGQTTGREVVDMVRAEILLARGRYFRSSGTTAPTTIMLSAYINPCNWVVDINTHRWNPLDSDSHRRL